VDGVGDNRSAGNGEAMKITERTFRFSVRVVNVCRFLEKQGSVSRTLAGQLLRSGTSIGANVEEAQAGQSKPDFISKMSIACKEARETHYWLRLLIASDIVQEGKIGDLAKEADELVRILSTIVKSARTGKIDRET
jgi:four helix bundle protein